MRQKCVYLASTVHAALAAFILLLPYFPRPFGQLEPFFILLPPEVVALLFMCASVMPMIAMRAQWAERRMLYAVAPQQIILIYGAVGGLLNFVQEGDARSLVALSWSAPLALFHGFDVWELIKNRGVYGSGR